MSYCYYMHSWEITKEILFNLTPTNGVTPSQVRMTHKNQPGQPGTLGSICKQALPKKIQFWYLLIHVSPTWKAVRFPFKIILSFIKILLVNSLKTILINLLKAQLKFKTNLKLQLQ